MISSSRFIRPSVPGFVIADVDGTPLNGIFDLPYEDGANIESYSPSFTCGAAEQAAIPVTRASVFTINTIEYNPKTNPQLDGTGLAVIELEEA